MKTLANRVILLAASALALGSVAYGQTALKADIPFAFRASNTTMPAGSYTFYQDTRSGLVNVRLWNSTTHRGIVTTAGPLDIYKEGKPSVTFYCAGDACSLRAIRTAAGTLSYPAPRKAHGETHMALVSIPLTAGHGD
ncbi:MAG: hypothetical protein M3N54_10100 [Acidobacteriota bacterium]|nr:hypothetical protein [Acidobacteriota bacterium]